MTIFIGTVLSKITSDNPADSPVYEALTLEVKAYDADAARDAMAGMASGRPAITGGSAGRKLTRAIVSVDNVKPVLDDIYTDGVRPLQRSHFTDPVAYKSLYGQG